jgi:hypothetical protein
MYNALRPGGINRECKVINPEITLHTEWKKTFLSSLKYTSHFQYVLFKIASKGEQNGNM